MGNRTMTALRLSATEGACTARSAAGQAVKGSQAAPHCTTMVLLPQPSDHGRNMAGNWPRRTSLELGALPSAVACARLHAKHVLREWGLAALSEPVELLLSELLTNAVKAARSIQPISPVCFWLMSDHTRVLILVWDANPQPPVRIDVADDAESGRGLLLVEAISEQWNWYLASETGGKVVWCLLTK